MVEAKKFQGWFNRVSEGKIRQSHYNLGHSG